MAKAKKLTTAEKTAIGKAAARGVKFVSGKAITREEKAAILAAAEELKNAPKSRFSKEAVTLWSARVNYAIANSDRKNLRSLLATPGGPEAAPRAGAVIKAPTTQFWDDNGGCSCGSGGGGGTANW